MSRRTKQMLAAGARNAAEASAFVPVLLLSEVNVEQCNQAQFLDIIANLDELYGSKPTDERPKFIEQVYHRMLQVLSKAVAIPTAQVTNVVRHFVVHHPTMAILTLDDLQRIGVAMERRSIIIHFDMSGSMAVAGFAPLVQSIGTLFNQFIAQGIEVHVSMFGGPVQQRVHDVLNSRLLTLNEFITGNHRPQGGTAFCPSFARTQDFPTAYDAIIISDGEFTDNVTQLAFQEQCKTVFFIAPPWSPKGVEQKHAASIASAVHANVPYIGIASEQYAQLTTILEQYMREHHSFARLAGFVAVGQYVLPGNLLAPTEMTKIYRTCFAQGEAVLSAYVKKMLGVFRYLDETAKLNFERCLKGVEFQNLMSLVTPLIKTAYGDLENSVSCQQLYGYLATIMSTFQSEKHRLVKRLAANEAAVTEINKFWESAMSFCEKDLIVAEAEKKYGMPVGYLHLRVDSLTCTAEVFSEALQNLKIVFAAPDLDLLALVFDLLASCKISERPMPGPEASTIPVWRKPDGTIDLLSILRMLPLALQQFEHLRNVPTSNPWTLQPTAAIRLAWIMDVSGRVFPDFITNALPSLVVPNKFLTDLNLDENRAALWMKVVRQLAPKLDLPDGTLPMIERLVTVHLLKSFLLRLVDGAVTYEKPMYENVLPMLDTDDPKAWCIFTDHDQNRVDATTGNVVQALSIITSPAMVDHYYAENYYRHGSVVRPRYLTLRENPSLPEGAIELYQAGGKKDVDILRDQLVALNGGSISSDQINAHIYTVRDRYKSIPVATWGATEQIANTLRAVKEACADATLPTETVTVQIPRQAIIDYLLAHAPSPFIGGAFRGLHEYPRVAHEESMAGMTMLDYAIECGEKTTDLPDYETMRFSNLDKPGVRDFLQRALRRLTRALRSVARPPQLSSVSALLQQAQAATVTDEVLSLADLEAMPAHPATTPKPTTAAPSTVLGKELFTCPITLDIMENPATTAPCGHMFEMDAITAYLAGGVTACPSCRTAVTGVSLNHAFKNVIEAWSAQQTD